MLDKINGLTNEEVRSLELEGLTNEIPDKSGKTALAIIRDNVFTYFNLIFLVLSVLLIMAGAFRSLTFMPVVIANSLIGIIQQLHAKKVLDKLNVMSAPEAVVIREGEEKKIPVSKLVLGDVIFLKAGSQIPADAKVISGNISVNESLLTGEADEVEKGEGSELMSGSFLVTGECYAKLTAVGKDSYISKLTAEAKKLETKESSEMVRDINKIVVFAGIAIIPVGLLLFGRSFFIAKDTFRTSVTSMVAAVVGMIPEGLYLLTSVALALSAARLAKKKVLLHDMKSVETLARTDVLCVDKTGTITTSRMFVTEDILALSDGAFLYGNVLPKENAKVKEEALEAEENLEDADLEEAFEEKLNQEKEALLSKDNLSVKRKTLGKKRRSCKKKKSAKKRFSAKRSYFKKKKALSDDNSLNEEENPDLVKEPPIKKISSNEEKSLVESAETLLALYINSLNDDNNTTRALKEKFKAPEGKHLKVVKSIPFSSKNKYSAIESVESTYKLGAPEVLLKGNNLKNCTPIIDYFAAKGKRVIVFTKDDEPVLLIVIENEIRKNAREIFNYLKKQGVMIRVISGDNPVTVSRVAALAGINHADSYVDARELKTGEAIEEAVDKYAVFGRVTPEQKREIINAIKKRGFKVAMTGDGVNDILAMKDADCSIAMGSGSDAAMQAAQVVLLDDDFSRMKNIIFEGRRNINNITRSATLFLVKNMFSLLLAIYSIVLGMNYPIKAEQVSLIAMFTIGTPAFLLALEPDSRRAQDHFLKRVLIKAMPAGLTDFFAVVALTIFAKTFTMSEDELSVAATFLLAIVGFIILANISAPLNKYRVLVITGMILGMLLTSYFLDFLFGIKTLSKQCYMLFTLFAIATEPCMRYLTMFGDYLEGKLEDRRDRKKRREV
jgi:cation-transporting ATPase E